MRHFSSAVRVDSFFSVDPFVSFNDEDLLDIQRALVITMDANPELLTPGEEGVLADFSRWFRDLKEDYLSSRLPRSPVFIYVNVYRGYSLVVVGCSEVGRCLVRLCNG